MLAQHCGGRTSPIDNRQRSVAAVALLHARLQRCVPSPSDSWQVLQAKQRAALCIAQVRVAAGCAGGRPRAGWLRALTPAHTPLRAPGSACLQAYQDQLAK